MWQLIGETPPESTSPQVQKAEPDRDAQKTEVNNPDWASAQAVKQRTQSATVHSAVSNDTVEGEFPGQMAVAQPGSVQRQEDEGASAVLAGQVDRQLASGPNAGEQSQSADNNGLDELVRQVYAEIRHRLSVEREWFRGGH